MSHELIARAQALVARARVVHEESQELVAYAHHFVVPVMCHRCGATIYWKRETPPYRGLCGRCSKAE